MCNLIPLKFLGQKAAELGPQKGNLDTRQERRRSRNALLREVRVLCNFGKASGPCVGLWALAALLVMKNTVYEKVHKEDA